MDRRDFAKSLTVKAGALSALAAAPAGFLASSLPAEAKTRDPGLLYLCRAILKQNLLKAGEMMIVATGYIFPEDYVAAMLQRGIRDGCPRAACARLPQGRGERTREIRAHL